MIESGSENRKTRDDGIDLPASTSTAATADDDLDIACRAKLFFFAIEKSPRLAACRSSSDGTATPESDQNKETSLNACSGLEIKCGE